MINNVSFSEFFRQKNHPVLSNILLGQFGPKTNSGRIALWALLHRQKLVEIEHFAFFQCRNVPAFI